MVNLEKITHLTCSADFFEESHFNPYQFTTGKLRLRVYLVYLDMPHFHSVPPSFPNHLTTWKTLVTSDITTPGIQRKSPEVVTSVRTAQSKHKLLFEPNFFWGAIFLHVFLPKEKKKQSSNNKKGKKKGCKRA